MTSLVLLSGWGIDARIWQSLAPYWPEDITVRTPDWPGYGKRIDDCLPATLCELANQVADDLPGDAIWVGWSLGGLLAGALVTYLPPPRALVMIGTGARFCHAGGVSRAELATFRRAFARDPHATWQHFLRWQLQGEPAPRTMHRRLIDLIGRRPSASAATLSTGLEQLSRIDLAPLLASPPCPILRIAGERDGLMAEPDRLTSDLQLADSGHCPQLSRPDALAHYLVELLHAFETNDEVVA